MKYRRSQIREAWAVLEAQDISQWPNWPREAFEKGQMIDEDEPRVGRLALRHFQDRHKPVVLLDAGEIGLFAVEPVVSALDLVAAACRRLLRRGTAERRQRNDQGACPRQTRFPHQSVTYSSRKPSPQRLT